MCIRDSIYPAQRFNFHIGTTRLNPNAAPFRPMLTEPAEVPAEATFGGGVWNFAILDPSLLADGGAAAKQSAVRKKDKPAQQAAIPEKAKPSPERSPQQTLPKAAHVPKSKPASPAASTLSASHEPR